MSTKVTANGCYWLSWLGEIRFTSSMSGGAESDRTWTAFEKTIPCAHKAEFSIIPCYWIWGLSIFFLFFEGNPSLCSFTDEMKCDLLGVDDRNDQVIGMRQLLLKTLIWDKKNTSTLLGMLPYMGWTLSQSQPRWQIWAYQQMRWHLPMAVAGLYLLGHISVMLVNWTNSSARGRNKNKITTNAHA